jgi:hypothetical protein
VVRFAGWVSATELNDILHAADLAQAIKRLHDDRGRLAELAANGRLAQARNGWGVQRGVYLGVYDALLGPASGRAGECLTSATSGGPGSRSHKG